MLVWMVGLGQMMPARTIDRFDVGETFFDGGLNDLDLFLMPKGATSIDQHIASSECPNYWNLEHVFHQISNTGEYEIWVYQDNAPLLGDQYYGLAWWAIPEPMTLVLLVLGGLGLYRGRR